MPMSTRSRAPAALPIASSNARPVKKDTSKQKPPKTVEKVQPIKETTDHGSESSEDETPLALLKGKPSAPTKASKTIVATVKTSTAKAQEIVGSESNNIKGVDQNFVLPAKISSKTKSGPKKIVGAVNPSFEQTYIVGAGKSDDSPNDAVQNTQMDETFVVPAKIPCRIKVGAKKPVGTVKSPPSETSKVVGSVSDEENSPVVNDPKKKMRNNQIQDESSEGEADISPKANIVSKKAKPIIIPIKPKKQFEELVIAPECPVSNDNGINEPTSTDETENQSADESEDSDEEYEETPPQSKLHAATVAKKTNVNEAELVNEDVDEALCLKPPKKGRKKPGTKVEPPQIELAQPEDPAKLKKGGARKKEIQSSNIESSNIVEEVASLENTASAKHSKKPVKKATAKKGTRLDNEGLSDLMNSLDLNEGVSKKGKLKKGSAAAKSKARGKKTAATESDSEPETTLAKYSSTESLKNVTMTRGMVKSVSEDNLHTMVTALPDRPKRAAKPAISIPDPEEESVKKSRAPKKKTGK